MCLGVPMQVKTIENEVAICEIDGVRREASLMMIDEVQVGFSILIGNQALDSVIAFPHLEAEDRHEIRKASAEHQLQLILGNVELVPYKAAKMVLISDELEKIVDGSPLRRL